MRALVLALILFTTATTALAQPAPVDTAAKRRAMQKLAFLVGDWGGEATAMVGRGQQVRLWQTEWVRYKLNGQILAVEGVGRRLTPTGPADTLFNAWAVIDWQPQRGYFMRSNVLDGRSGEFPLEVSDSGFVWGFEVPGGRVRYTMSVTPEGGWHERGAFSRDGTQWFPTIEMKLARSAPATP